METRIMDGNVYKEACPTRLALDRIADKWTTLIIGLLENRPRRFSELKREIEGISQKMLTQTLRGLERDGLVTRTVYAQIPPRVEYELTALGQTLCEPIAAIRHWAEANINEIVDAQAIYDLREVSEA
ncbi:MAG: helix-turn-helix transcriptional regulator [Anaerolineales bacterium]|nr:helix-turn-helix transcriptional regulator [Anaerolineales bacterium]